MLDPKRAPTIRFLYQTDTNEYPHETHPQVVSGGRLAPFRFESTGVMMRATVDAPHLRPDHIELGAAIA